MAKTGIPTRGENIVHFGSIRFGVIGSGDFNISSINLAETVVKISRPIVLQDPDDYEPTRLIGVKSQRMSFEFSIEGIGSYFQIRRILVYTKPIYSEKVNR
jgi:hypothetical protein